MKQDDYQWTDDNVIDFVNYYLKLHKLDFTYFLENETVIEDFKKQKSLEDFQAPVSDDCRSAVCYRCHGSGWVERPAMAMPCPDCNVNKLV